MKSHTEVIPYNCDQCDYKFEEKIQLKKHIENQHNVDLLEDQVAKPVGDK